MQAKQEMEAIKALSNKKDKEIVLSENKWYRIAETEIQGNDILPTSSILKVGTNYASSSPICLILGLTTAFNKANIEELTSYKLGGTNHADKARVQFDSTNKKFFFDIHYAINLENKLLLNFLTRDFYWKFSNNNNAIEYETVVEINL